VNSFHRCSLRLDDHPDKGLVFHVSDFSCSRVSDSHIDLSSASDSFLLDFGNVCIAGHNREVPTSIGTIKNLKDGDEIKYVTQYGTRIYEVYSVEKIGADDTSVLGWSAENVITLITCLENQPQYRVCVKAMQKN
jgi:LPXTG-site transpeptidase (sortase) family protein